MPVAGRFNARKTKSTPARRGATYDLAIRISANVHDFLYSFRISNGPNLGDPLRHRQMLRTALFA